MRTRAAEILGSLAWLLATLHAIPSGAGTQQYEVLSASARASLSKAIADKPAPDGHLIRNPDGERWLAEMHARLEKRAPGRFAQTDDARAFLNTVHYEATRAGLDPHLVLAVIDVESKFRKYAVSKSGARGYMQVMPFWVKEIGQPGNNLFNLRTNLRYGCIVLRHYLDIEKGNLARALGRYNGSLGRPEYPEAVSRAWKTAWQ